MSSGSKLFVGKADHGAPLTHEEFAEAEFEEPWRYERVKGKLVVMPPSGEGTVNAQEPLRDHLGAYKLAHPEIVDKVVREAWFFIDKDTDRIADIGVYLMASHGRAPIPQRVPEITFEIVSEGSTSHKRDYEDKCDDYKRAGVQEYVIADRFQHRMTILRRKRGRFVETLLGPEDVYTSPLLPGLEIPLNEIIG